MTFWGSQTEQQFRGELGDVSVKFAESSGREPTFWLNKACIDQDNIADGLRCLPGNVMACTKILMLLAPTYVNRLWCIWVVFTFIDFNFRTLDHRYLRCRSIS